MKKYFLLLLFLLLPMNLAMAEGSAHYYAPPGQFNAVMQVMELGLASVFGLFGNATGSFVFDNQSKTIGNIRLAIDATSLVGGNSQGQHDLAELIDTTKYAEIRFMALDNVVFTDNKATIKGTLTLRGISKPAVFEATLNHTGKTAHGSNNFSGETDVLGLSMRTGIKRTDFGMTDDAEQPGRFGDVIGLQLEMQAIRQ